MAITLSIIIPAYNESRRLPPFLESVRGHLDGRHGSRYEVIVVDDGSSDGLSDLLAPLEVEWPELKVIRHPENRGKGAAVRTGMLAAAGQLLLFADADGATPIDQEVKLSEAIEAGADLAIGSRRIAGADVRRQRTWTRAVVGRIFSDLARWSFRISVRDTQCGFKMFKRDVGRKLFSRTTETGYLFDIELLVLAERLGYQVAEVPVNWLDVPGGNLGLFRASFAIPLGLWRLRRRLREA